MKIFYLKKNEILNKIGLNELEKFSDGKNFSNIERYIEHLCWLYLVNFAAKNHLNINNPKIIYNGKKPILQSQEYNFSVTHSENIVAVGFSKHKIGIDIEKMKNRNFEKLARRYNISPNKEDFYKFWTTYEAEIKLGDKAKNIFSQIIEKDYMLTCICNSKDKIDFDIIKI